MGYSNPPMARGAEWGKFCPLDPVLGAGKFDAAFAKLLFTCAPAMLRAGIVFGGVWLSVSVCPHKISKTTDQKLM